MPVMKMNTSVEPPDTLTADHVVALNLRIFRKVAHLTMKQVGEQLTHFTGQSYTPQSISYWENSAGKDNARPCTAQELVGLSKILSVPVATMVTVPTDDRWLTTPVRGVDGRDARWLYSQFTAGSKLAKAYLDENAALVSWSMLNSWTLQQAYDELRLEDS
jgi:hypothetical protein